MPRPSRSAGGSSPAPAAGAHQHLLGDFQHALQRDGSPCYLGIGGLGQPDSHMLSMAPPPAVTVIRKSRCPPPTHSATAAQSIRGDSHLVSALSRFSGSTDTRPRTLNPRYMRQLTYSAPLISKYVVQPQSPKISAQWRKLVSKPT